MLEKIKRAVSPRMQRIHHHPFNRELYAGTLPRKKFRAYLEQDALYLTDFSSALRVTAERMPDARHVKKIKQFSENALQTQRDLHYKYLGEKQWARFFRQNIYPVQKSSVIVEYSNHIMHHATQKPIEVAVASLMPCFWIYGELGKNMSDVLNNPNHPYHAWICSYANPDFHQSIQEIIDIAEELACKNQSPQKEQDMVNAFLASTECEIKFWDCAYHDADFKENQAQMLMPGVKIP